MKEFLNEYNTNVINSLYTHNIKKCPFCGGKAGITWDRWKDDESKIKQDFVRLEVEE